MNFWKFLKQTEWKQWLPVWWWYIIVVMIGFLGWNSKIHGWHGMLLAEAIWIIPFFLASFYEVYTIYRDKKEEREWLKKHD